MKVVFGYYAINSKEEHNFLQSTLAVNIPKGCKLVVYAENKVTNEFTQRAYAYCSKNDEPDINVGKWLAKKRLFGCTVTEQDYRNATKRTNKTKRK